MKTTTHQTGPTLDVTGQGEQFPLSFQQERIWVAEKISASEGVYNTPVALRIEGPVNRELLESSIALLIDRHETLRTIFIETSGKQTQVVMPTARASVMEVDLSGLAAANQRLCDVATRPTRASGK